VTTPDPAHIDAVARAAGGPQFYCDQASAENILTSTDPAVHAAMLDALTRHGVLFEEIDAQQAWSRPPAYHARRLVTPWEVAP